MKTTKTGSVAKAASSTSGKAKKRTNELVSDAGPSTSGTGKTKKKGVTEKLPVVEDTPKTGK